MDVLKIKSTIIVCLICVVAIFIMSCKDRNHSDEEVQISSDSLMVISQLWKTDSMGCLHLRNPHKITRLIEQTNLIGKDSTLIKKYLGEPNQVSFLKGEKYYTYWLECVGEKNISYSNFYCYFRGDSLYSYRHSIY